MAIFYSVVEDDPLDSGGTTDDKGQTHLLATVVSEEEIHIYLGSAA